MPNITGSVFPVGPVFGQGASPPNVDADGFADWVDPEGNFLGDDPDPFDELGGTADNNTGRGRSWDEVALWENYESRHNLLIGEGGAGEVSTNATHLRLQHIVVGGDRNVGAAATSELLTVVEGSGVPSPSAFDYAANAALAVSATNPANGYGVLTVSGFGDFVSNDPHDMEQSEIDALQIVAAARSSTWTLGTDPTPDPGYRAHNAGFCLHIGLRGEGLVSVSNGGRVTVQNLLTVGFGAHGSGALRIDGPASVVQVRGNQSFQTAAASPKSKIGGSGAALVEVTNEGLLQLDRGADIAAEAVVDVEDAHLKVGAETDVAGLIRVGGVSTLSGLFSGNGEIVCRPGSVVSFDTQPTCTLRKQPGCPEAIIKGATVTGT